MACSRACLELHQRKAHPEQAGEASELRARAAARASNRRFPDSFARYTGHREQLMLRIAELPGGADVCVLGAGNCSDLDFAQLARVYSEIHLADLDGEALERSRARQPAAIRNKISLHPELDLSGLLSKLDDWGDAFPSRSELGASAVAAARGIVQQLGRRFSTIVSTCVLSQLAVPFRQTWITTGAHWADLLGTLSAVHLATLAGSTEPGGHALLVFDAASSKDCPALTEWGTRAGSALQACVEQARAQARLTLSPSPADLLRQLGAPGLSALVTEPELSMPWLWELGDATQLVYALKFRHP